MAGWALLEVLASHKLVNFLGHNHSAIAKAHMRYWLEQ